MKNTKDITETAMSAVMHKNKSGWLDCFANDALLRDPVGGSPLDPNAQGLRGRTQLSLFWDTVVEPLKAVSFEVREQHSSGPSIAKVATVTLTLPNEQRAQYPGIFVYDLNQDGLIQTLKGYFQLPKGFA